MSFTTENIKNFVIHNESKLVFVIALITLLVYSPVLWFDFVNYDDPVYVVLNPNIQAGFTLEAIVRAFTEPYEVNWIPLTWISHMLDVQLFGMNPAGHHAVNVLMHAGSACMLFLFLRRSTGMVPASFTVALLFALHPLRVESVAWISERKDVLSAFFGMLALYAYLLYAEKGTVSRYLAALCLFALGLMAKPMLITLPAILLLLDWWPLGRMKREDGGASDLRTMIVRLGAEKLPFFALSVCSAFITVWAQSIGGNLTQGYTVAMRAGRAFISYLTYLLMTAWPVDLAVFYPFEKYPPSMFKMVGSLLILIALTIVFFLVRKRYPYILFGWLWYLITLLPVIGFIQIGQHSVADRYTYIPSIGLFLAIIWCGVDCKEKWRISNSIAGSVAASVLAVTTLLTVLQLRHWKNSSALFSHAISVTSGNWIAHHNLGLDLIGKGQDDEALKHFYLSVQAKPSYALAFIGIGALKHKKGEYEAAIDAYNSALIFSPNILVARLGLGLVYVDMGEKVRALEELRILSDFGSSEADELLQKIVARFGPVK
jgi:hypothetical protein